jgi:hypothetical protein
MSAEAEKVVAMIISSVCREEKRATNTGTDLAIPCVDGNIFCMLGVL